MDHAMRPVAGYEGLYSVTADGRVWSHARRKGRGMRPGRWLRPGRTSAGYLAVVLIHRGVKWVASVHRLIAAAWVPNDDPATKIEINHLDGIKTHNEASNLEWCTRSHNLLHAYRVGLRKPRRGGLLTAVQAAEVRSRVASGEPPIRVAEAFGIARQVVHSIVHNRSYLHI